MSILKERRWIGVAAWFAIAVLAGAATTAQEFRASRTAHTPYSKRLLPP